MAKFSVGEWAALLEASLDAAVAGASAQARRRRGQKDTLECRAARALGFAPMGKLSSARQALEGAAGDDNTWKAFSDETKKPRMSRVPLDDRVLTTNPSEIMDLEVDLLLKTMRSAKWSSAGGPSGMTVEHFETTA